MRLNLLTTPKLKLKNFKTSYILPPRKIQSEGFTLFTTRFIGKTSSGKHGDEFEVTNIYLNYLDTVWENKFTELGTLVRYAGDLVILCKTKADALKSINVLKAVFGKLELQMNTTKSKLINLWDDKAGFDFLGMHQRKIPKQVKGLDRYMLRSYPSKKAMKNMKQKVKEVTEPRNRLFWTMNRMVEELNPKIQGWKNYYAMDAFADLFLNKIDWYIRKRRMLFWNKKRNCRKKQSKFSLVGIVAQQSGLKKLVG